MDRSKSGADHAATCLGLLHAPVAPRQAAPERVAGQLVNRQQDHRAVIWSLLLFAGYVLVLAGVVGATLVSEW